MQGEKMKKKTNKYSLLYFLHLKILILFHPQSFLFRVNDMKEFQIVDLGYGLYTYLRKISKTEWLFLQIRGN